mgnify:FL=1
MPIVSIVKIPDPLLNQKSQKVGEFTPEAKEIIQNLLDTVRQPNSGAAGLSAPQIGKLLRICVARRFIKNPNDPEKEITKEYVLVNPKIITASNEKRTHWEGCLSIPDTFGLVERPAKIKIKAQDENGQEITIKSTGFFATVIQHEIDHLDGILFTSKVIGKTLNEKELDEMFAAVPVS